MYNKNVSREPLTKLLLYVLRCTLQSHRNVEEPDCWSFCSSERHIRPCRALVSTVDRRASNLSRTDWKNNTTDATCNHL